MVQRYSTALAEANAAEQDHDLVGQVAALSRVLAYATVLADDEPLGGAWTSCRNIVDRRLESLLSAAKDA
jgi:hypothetical protein